MSFVELGLVHLAATAFMAGLIWTIHVVHYPLFALVNEPSRPFQEAHMSRITWLLIVPWATEGLTALALVPVAAAGPDRAVAVLGVLLLAAITLVTALGAAPTHGRLVDGYEPELLRRLLHIDLVRAVLWSARLVLAGWLVWPR